jgi:hypothetical protein
MQRAPSGSKTYVLCFCEADQRLLDGVNVANALSTKVSGRLSLSRSRESQKKRYQIDRLQLDNQHPNKLHPKR